MPRVPRDRRTQRSDRVRGRQERRNRREEGRQDRQREGSPGARNYTLYFQNSSNSSCTLRGYPRVVHAGPSGTWVGREASTSDEYMNSAGVTLNPGDSTTAVLRSVYPARFGDDCGSRPVQGFLVGLPSGSGGVIVPLDTTACSSSVPQLSVGQFGAR